MSTVTSEPGVATQNSETYYGCVPLEKSNAVIVGGGAPATIEYQIRDAQGAPVDLSSFFDQNDPGGEKDRNGLFIRFAVADNTLIAKRSEQGHVIDARLGKVQFPLPDYVYDIPCIYTFHFAVGDRQTYPVTGRPVWVAPGRGVLLVEWTPFVTHNDRCPMKHRVVPAVEDIRRKLDDFTGKNDLMAQVEYSTDDIVNAMIWPVAKFNELPPQLRRYKFTLMNFPYYENWLIGTASELLRLSVIHLTRNKLLSSHGGITGDEKNRDQEFLRLATQYREEFLQWARLCKSQLNINQVGGTLYSNYVFRQHWRY
jgi:hypothetical protein